MFKEYWEVTHAGLHMLDKLAGGIIWEALDILIFISISRFRQKRIGWLIFRLSW